MSIISATARTAAISVERHRNVHSRFIGVPPAPLVAGNSNEPLSGAMDAPDFGAQARRERGGSRLESLNLENAIVPSHVQPQRHVPCSRSISRLAKSGRRAQMPVSRREHPDDSAPRGCVPGREGLEDVQFGRAVNCWKTCAALPNLIWFLPRTKIFFPAVNLNLHPPLPNRKDFRIGILGSGFIVSDCHLVSYRKAGFNPVAIASRSRENAAKVAAQHSIPKVCDTYEQLLDDPSIEVLDIAVPPNAQLALIKAACIRKTVKGILAQKPLGMDYAEALEAVRCCEQAGIALAVNQNMRYDQSVRAGKTLLENGTIGEPARPTVA